MFTRKCPCCDKQISLINFLKASPNGSENKVYDITCKQCKALLIPKKTFGKFVIVLWTILLAQPFLVMAIRKFISKDEFYYYASLLGFEFGILMLISLLVLFHNVVSKSHICKNEDTN